MSDADDPVISVRDLDVHFEDSSMLNSVTPSWLSDRLGLEEDPTVHAVDDISLDLGENDVLALVGESGSGKTTLGKTMVGLTRPTSGSVEYRGHDIWDVREGEDDEITFEEIRRSLQIIHQDPGSALNPYRSVLENLEVPLKRWHPELNYAERRGRILKLLERTGISPPEDYAERYVHQLSGGEQQRVALIRALLVEPEVILADEAVSALDVSLRIGVMDLFLEMQEIFDTSFVFISHDLANARYLAGKSGGKIGVMYLGELVELGTAEEIIQNPKHPYTKVLQWATPELDPEQAEQAMRESPPVRKIDIPDATNPPSGCRFHTRCPKAREACREQSPEFYESDSDEPHKTKCFREVDDHEYWESEDLVDEDAFEESSTIDDSSAAD
ncbi:ABC transporter ATP-binding protein [Halopiger xanaduensis]|uniref:Oligopeptide/dipeptide ABC transporter, ATPase subunit n=1 Tax=Halopiger xanaduensis (strain DSM 18323 / JCM 14033 / SH-6) TaxID=797210 RepID=F8DCB8_HALXS|nr:ABC transporter ATP-binding protein [Halopiger xanaduensis]AEH38375.1 oligopeptide/dipeptide ABC transporter, ATPase subunit [Halopiger xanaduensis SH-6]